MRISRRRRDPARELVARRDQRCDQRSRRQHEQRERDRRRRRRQRHQRERQPQRDQQVHARERAAPRPRAVYEPADQAAEAACATSTSRPVDARGSSGTRTITAS